MTKKVSPISISTLFLGESTPLQSVHHLQSIFVVIEQQAIWISPMRVRTRSSIPNEGSVSKDSQVLRGLQGCQSVQKHVVFRC